MQTGQESGCEFLDPRSLTWEQRYALKRRAAEWAHDERAHLMAGVLRRLWEHVSRGPRTWAGPRRGSAAGRPRPVPDLIPIGGADQKPRPAVLMPTAAA
jgi:hypothetical protein